MKILVLSDSHSALRFMHLSIQAIQPDAVIHLGDYVADGDAVASDYPSLPFFQVAGNCDRNRVDANFPEILVKRFDGVSVYMTHGHLQGVKLYKEKLIDLAQKAGADIALYGHTHEPDCRLLENGMWLMNPGSCGYYGGSVGMITIKDTHEIECRILYQRDLEGLL